MNIVFGKYDILTKKESGVQFVYDIVRMKWIVLTPEEQVRQVWLHYLIYDLNKPKSNIAVEKSLRVNNKIKRFDICIFNNNIQPETIIECKAPHIPIHQPSLEQISVYNIALKAKKFILTNGIQHVGFEITHNQFLPLMEI